MHKIDSNSNIILLEENKHKRLLAGVVIIVMGINSEAFYKILHEKIWLERCFKLLML